jgi:hypothetical protein
MHAGEPGSRLAPTAACCASARPRTKVYGERRRLIGKDRLRSADTIDSTSAAEWEPVREGPGAARVPSA